MRLSIKITSGGMVLKKFKINSNKLNFIQINFINLNIFYKLCQFY